MMLNAVCARPVNSGVRQLPFMSVINTLLAVALVCSLAKLAPAEPKRVQSAGRDVRISKRHPTIYITFERLGKAVNHWETRMAETGEPSKFKEAGQDFWLRIHNNTRWAIRFSTANLYLGSRTVAYTLPDGSKAVGLGEGMEINANYGVGEDNGAHVELRRIDMSYGSLLPPGRSVIFRFCARR